MGQLGDDIEKWGADVIFGRRRGFGAWLARIVLRGFSFLYGGAVRLRLKAFRQHWKHQGHLGTLVISIGNLTVGGTGMGHSLTHEGLSLLGETLYLLPEDSPNSEVLLYRLCRTP